MYDSCYVAEGHLKALEYMAKMNDNENYNVFNLGSGDGHSVLEVLTTFERLLGYRLNY